MLVDRRLRGRAGQRMREQVRREEPYCRECLKGDRRVLTVDVDHIRPLSAGGSNARSNMQGLCRSCHDAKTRSERGNG